MSEDKLYRYMSFESFVEIIQTETLTLVHPEMWEDKFEGYLFRAMKLPAAREKINDYVEQKLKDHDWNYISSAWENTRCQSWSAAGNSVAMWSIYNYNNKAIMIQTTKQKLEKLDGVTLEEVEYTDNLDLDGEISKCISRDESSINLTKSLRSKRIAFGHEKEWRLIKHFEYDTTKYTREEITVPMKLEIEMIEDFIESVMVHPSAEIWYVETVEKYCEINNIKFNGKSKLYKFDI